MTEPDPKVTPAAKSIIVAHKVANYGDHNIITTLLRSKDEGSGNRVEYLHDVCVCGGGGGEWGGELTIKILLLFLSLTGRNRCHNSLR